MRTFSRPDCADRYTVVRCRDEQYQGEFYPIRRGEDEQNGDDNYNKDGNRYVGCGWH
jgi:hypothetical protein